MKIQELLAEGPNLKSNADVVKRLEYLNSKLTKYAHRWGENASSRMLAWVDEYNTLKSTHEDAWREYCEKHNFALSHNGYDCMA